MVCGWGGLEVPIHKVKGGVRIPFPTPVPLLFSTLSGQYWEVPVEYSSQRRVTCYTIRCSYLTIAKFQGIIF